MFIGEHRETLKISKEVFQKYQLDKIAFFDIETTGFDKVNNNIILISIGYFLEDEVFLIKQYFADCEEDESEVLILLSHEVANFDNWCSYNGIAFDEPFIKKRMELKGLEFELPQIHTDLYKLIKPYHKEMGMARCNLKTVEKFIGVAREDQIDGGESVELYNEYLSNKDEELRDIIMLHNFEDVLNLPKIFKLLFDAENNNIKRSDGITVKQLSYLKSLVKKHKLQLSFDLDKISKSAASKLIDHMINGNSDIIVIEEIVKRY